MDCGWKTEIAQASDGCNKMAMGKTILWKSGESPKSCTFMQPSTAKRELLNASSWFDRQLFDLHARSAFSCCLRLSIVFFAGRDQIWLKRPMLAPFRNTF